MSATMPCSNTAALNEYDIRQEQLLKYLEENQKLRDKIKERLIDAYEDDFTEWRDLLSQEERDDLLTEILFADQTDRDDMTYVIQKERERVAEAMANQEVLHTDDY